MTDTNKVEEIIQPDKTRSHKWRYFYVTIVLLLITIYFIESNNAKKRDKLVQRIESLGGTVHYSLIKTRIHWFNELIFKLDEIIVGSTYFDFNLQKVTSIIIDSKPVPIELLDKLTLFKSLNSFTLDNNQIKNLTPIGNLISLKELWINNNQITDIRPLARLSNLLRLDLSENKITDLSPLKTLKKLERLTLFNNKITDLTPLAELTLLSELYLDANQISNLRPLTSLKKLRILSLFNNHIVNLGFLTDLPQLETVYLAKNEITDITPLKKLLLLKWLTLNNNPQLKLNDIIELKNTLPNCDINYKKTE